MKTENECCKCGHRWQDKPWGYAKTHACPKCGSAYWKWLNYPQIRRVL